jgi:hypothetical protein
LADELSFSFCLSVAALARPRARAASSHSDGRGQHIPGRRERLVLASIVNGVFPTPLPQDGVDHSVATDNWIHRGKTGALIRASAVAGAIMGGASEIQATAIDRYAAELGLAFQIVDDILDVEGDAAQLGKSTGKDAAAGKPTYPSLYGLARSREMAEECITRAARALGGAGLADSWLLGIGRWIVERRN